jgi:hypothetical protein
MDPNEREILRVLPRRYLEICQAADQPERRRLWQMHNSLKCTRPLIYVRAFGWVEIPELKLVCLDLLFRHYENFLRYPLFWNSLADDSIFEPWVTVPARHR